MPSHAQTARGTGGGWNKLKARDSFLYGPRRSVMTFGLRKAQPRLSLHQPTWRLLQGQRPPPSSGLPTPPPPHHSSAHSPAAAGG